MRVLLQRRSQTRHRALPTIARAVSRGATHELPTLRIQRTIGNQATMRRLRQSENAPAPGIVGEVLRSPGRPLDATTRTNMDARFNFDFSGVRIHDDARSADSASTISAQAYTVGSHLVFGSGQYSPGSSSGRRLLAHELTHVVQQSATGATPQRFSIGQANSPAEREADAVADAVVTGGSPSQISGTSAATLQRKRLADTSGKERILDLGSDKALACCDSNACVDDASGFECSSVDCKTESNDATAINNSTKQPGHKFSPHLKCDIKCGKDFKATYSGKELVVALPKRRRNLHKDQCGQTLGICANHKSVEVTIKEFSNHNIWEASPGVAAALGVAPDFFGSVYESGADPDMKDDPNCVQPPAKPSPQKPSPQKPKSEPKSDKK